MPEYVRYLLQSSIGKFILQKVSVFQILSSGNLDWLREGDIVSCLLSLWKKIRVTVYDMGYYSMPGESRYLNSKKKPSGLLMP